MSQTGAILLAASMLAALPVAAQRMELSMKRAVEIASAEEGSVKLKLAREAIRQAQSRTGEARASLLPHVSGSLSYENRLVNLEAFGVKFGIPGTPLETPSKVGPFDVVDARGLGSQTLFDYSAIRNYQAARQGLRATRSARDDTRDRVASEVAKAYLAALRAEARLEAARSNVHLAETLLQLAENQKAAGTGTGIDVTRAKVQLQNERQALLIAQNGRRRAHLELLRAMDLRLDVEVELSDRLTYHPIEIAAAEAALATALQSRADWRAQREREATAALRYSATKWERLPTVSFFGDYGTTGTAFNNAFPTRNYGVRLDLPVFDGGRMDARRAGAGAELRREKIRTADLKSRVGLEVRLALDALRSASDQVGVAQQGLELAGEELEQARRRFKAGVATSVEIADAQNRMARARDNRIAALYNYESARLDYGTAIGRVREFLQ